MQIDDITFHEFHGCASSNFLLQKMIYHKYHIYDLCCLHECCGCVSLNLNLEKMICQLPISYFLLVYNVEDAQIVLLEAILMEQL